MKLIGSLTSPYVRKVRIVLAEKKIEYEFELDSPWTADTKVPNLNPLGKIPVLVLDDSTVLFDSVMRQRWFSWKRSVRRKNKARNGSPARKARSSSGLSTFQASLAKRPGAPAIIFRWPTSALAARSAIWPCASRKLTGAKSIPIWRVCTPS